MRSPLFCLPAKLTFHALLLKTVFVLAFLVIVPLCNPAGKLWNLIEDNAGVETYTVPTVMLVSGVDFSLQANLRQSYR